MKAFKALMKGLAGSLLVASVLLFTSQLRADYSYDDTRSPPGDPEGHTYHVHVDHYYETWGPYLYDSYSWSEDYDETVYTSPGDSVNITDHVDEDSGNDGGQYWYSWNSFTYS